MDRSWSESTARRGFARLAGTRGCCRAPRWVSAPRCPSRYPTTRTSRGRRSLEARITVPARWAVPRDERPVLSPDSLVAETVWRPDLLSSPGLAERRDRATRGAGRLGARLGSRIEPAHEVELSGKRATTPLTVDLDDLDGHAAHLDAAVQPMQPEHTTLTKPSLPHRDMPLEHAPQPASEPADHDAPPAGYRCPSSSARWVRIQNFAWFQKLAKNRLMRVTSENRS